MTYTRTLNLTLAVALVLAFLIPAITHDAPMGGWVGSQGRIDTLPTSAPNAPEWQPEYAAQFPGCTGHKTDTAGDLVVYTLRGDLKRVDFGTAWERSHNTDDADDVWVIGWCAA